MQIYVIRVNKSMSFCWIST